MEVIRTVDLTLDVDGTLDRLNLEDTPAVLTKQGEIQALVIPIRDHGIDMSILYTLVEAEGEQYKELATWAETDMALRSDDPELNKIGTAAAESGRALVNLVRVHAVSELPQEMQDAIKESEEHPERRVPYVRKSPRTLTRNQTDDTAHLLASPENAKRLIESMKATRAGMYTEHELLEDDDVESGE